MSHLRALPTPPGAAPARDRHAPRIHKGRVVKPLRKRPLGWTLLSPPKPGPRLWCVDAPPDITPRWTRDGHSYTLELRKGRVSIWWDAGKGSWRGRVYGASLSGELTSLVGGEAELELAKEQAESVLRGMGLL